MSNRQEPNYLDTFAEAYFKNGMIEKAILVNEETQKIVLDKNLKAHLINRLVVYKKAK